MLKRKAESAIDCWLQSQSNTALLINGARQTGKTTLVRQYAQKHFDNFIEINFIEDTRAYRIFEDSLDTITLLQRITAYTKRKIVPNKTLLFLDEIQECPKARTAIKFLVDAHIFKVIESGSLLGIRYKEVPSYPVGYETELKMAPLDLEEFFIANGVSRKTIEQLKLCFEHTIPVDPVIHETLNRLFYAYIVVGGMPQVVQAYVDTHDLANVLSLQKNIIRLYRLDISKYAPEKEKENIKQIFDYIPSQLNCKNRRFVLSDISKSARMREYQSDFLWLSDAGVALPCYNVREPSIPLKQNEQASLMKLYQSDVGLLCANSINDVQFDILEGNLSINMGSILENLFAQEFVAHGYPLYFFNQRALGELDFVIQKRTDVLAVEIKSGNDYKKHKALDNILLSKKWPFSKAYVFCKGNIEINNDICYLPWYMSMFLNSQFFNDGNRIYEVDLSRLPKDEE